MENLNDLFNLTAGDLVEKNESKGGDIYKPTADKGKEGVYSSVIRFIPWHKNPKKSILKKWSCWLVDPLTDKGKFVDCPSTIGQKSILQDVYFKLKKSNSVAEQKLAEVFSRRQSMNALIQVIKDDNNPDLVGRIMVFPFGAKINGKIQDIMQPEFGTPHIPFDLFEGRAFHLKIKKVAGYNNYDDSKFLDGASPITIDGKKMEKTPDDMKKIIEYLEKSSPDLSKYDFTPWDEDTTAYVHNVIQNVVPSGAIVAGLHLTNSNQSASPAPKVVSDPLKSTPKPAAKSESKVAAPAPDPLPPLSEISDDLDLDESFDDELYADL